MIFFFFHLIYKCSICFFSISEKLKASLLNDKYIALRSYRFVIL